MARETKGTSFLVPRLHRLRQAKKAMGTRMSTSLVRFYEGMSSFQDLPLGWGRRGQKRGPRPEVEGFSFLYRKTSRRDLINGSFILLQIMVKYREQQTNRITVKDSKTDVSSVRPAFAFVRVDSLCFVPGDWFLDQ